MRGPIGEKISGFGKRPVIGFKRIDCQISTIDRSVLSRDQQYLLDISMAIKSGNGKENLAVPDPGPLSHSRRLATANRTLRLYLSEESPTNELQEIVVFISKSYMSIWFSIKTSKYFTEGPKLVNQSTQSSRYLPEDLRNLVDPVIKRNGFFAHPENLMLAMTQDNTKLIRELGLHRILKAR
ncbi:hypothetical protein AVEN_15789-1 [Araneus ventricosus]|uniref:Uncharacterized protein n=1 Tax=Araneus ventricosus TaxID=182803 RepID=A0A4Y2PKB8_ARAVE|nr:hypothetical protein AVEN_15789-1 [Araneus ventricosus]